MWVGGWPLLPLLHLYHQFQGQPRLPVAVLNLEKNGKNRPFPKISILQKFWACQETPRYFSTTTELPVKYTVFRRNSWLHKRTSLFLDLGHIFSLIFEVCQLWSLKIHFELSNTSTYYFEIAHLWDFL